MDINKTKLHYSSQVLPASEMCLLIVVGGRGAGMMWGAGMATLSGSNLSCLGFISSLFEIILFLIHSTQTSCPVLCP